ncbi:uroplakin-2 [Colossoma macropomum]|uniref:uroplakin-2 n=1 Tax=Colossoma macropomum TaxID=42526 RepID=UPI001864720F|nr:uroplakin-2 [Colossoma macropomum]
MLAVLFVLGGFVPLIDADFAPRVLTVEDGVLTGRFPDSLLLSLPPCNYSGQSVDLEYLNANTNENKILSNIFTINCTNGVYTAGSATLSRNIGYQVTNLTNGTEYKLRYKIGTTNSSYILATTRTVSDYNVIDEGLPARSGAMVVITVILSLAMFFLLICLILSTVMSTS